MILEVRKINSNAAKWLSIMAVLAGGWAFQQGSLIKWVCFSLFAVLLWLLSEVYFGLRLKEEEGKLQIGSGLGKMFRPQEEFFFHELKGLLIMQQSDRCYGLGLMLTSGRFVLLEKVANLDKAKARQLELTEQFDRALIRQKK